MRPSWTLRLAVALLVPACAPQPAADDGFSARIAAGCRTAEECDALHAAAEQRFKQCAAARGRVEGCEGQWQDRTTTSDMRRAQEKAAAKARFDTREARQKQGSDEADKFHTDSEHFGTSCADVAALKSEGTKVHSETLAARYQSLAESRRTTQVHVLQGSIKSSMRRRQIDRLEIPADERSAIAPTKALVEELRCFDAAAATAASGEVDAWAAALESDIVAEEKCRATPTCLAARLAKPLCSNIAARKDAVDGMATERRNPSGYVNTTLLHDLGRQIQTLEVEIREQRAEFAKTARAPFTEALCKRAP